MISFNERLKIISLIYVYIKAIHEVHVKVGDIQCTVGGPMVSINGYYQPKTINEELGKFQCLSVIRMCAEAT